LIKTPRVRFFYENEIDKESIERDLKDYKLIIINKEGVLQQK